MLRKVVGCHWPDCVSKNILYSGTAMRSVPGRIHEPTSDCSTVLHELSELDRAYRVLWSNDLNGNGRFGSYFVGHIPHGHRGKRSILQRW